MEWSGREGEGSIAKKRWCEIRPMKAGFSCSGLSGACFYLKASCLYNIKVASVDIFR